MKTLRSLIPNLQLGKEKAILLLNRKCHVEPFQCCAPQTLCSSHSLKMHEQLYQWGLESRLYQGELLPLLALPLLADTPATWAFFMWIDTLEFEQQTRQTPKATVTHQQQKPFSAWLSLTRCNYCTSPSHPHLQHVTDCPTTFNTWAVYWFDPAPHPLIHSRLSALWSNKDLPYF